MDFHETLVVQLKYMVVQPMVHSFITVIICLFLSLPFLKPQLTQRSYKEHKYQKTCTSK